MTYKSTSVHLLQIVASMIASGVAGQDAATVRLPSIESVFRVSTPYGDGSGFLVDESGLVVTNAHVTDGTSLVEVQLDDHYKVQGAVVFEDPDHDIALIMVHPEAVAGFPVLPLSTEAFDQLAVGDAVLVAGAPFGIGKTLTRGILSRKLPRTIVTDAAVNPGNSGGPMLDGRGRVVGVASFFIAETVGPGLGGGVNAVQAVASIAGADPAALAGVPVSKDSLPSMPTDVFPIEDLRALSEVDEWPLDLYDISTDLNQVTRRFEALMFTPLVQHFLALQGAISGQNRSGGDVVVAEDLRFWSLDLGAYAPVVIVRITPKTGQSAGAWWGNLLLAALGGATGSFSRPIDDPEFRGSVREVGLYADNEVVRPIQTRMAWSVLNGQAAQAAYVVLDPRLLCSPEGRATQWWVYVVDEDSYRGDFPIPEPSLAQVCSDFEGYLRAPTSER